MASDLVNLSLHFDYLGHGDLMISDGVSFPITHTGSLILPCPTTSFALYNVLCVTLMTKNLIFVSQL